MWPPIPAAADTSADHTFASVSVVMSAAVGPDVPAPLSQEAEAASSFEVKGGWRNLYPGGGTYITALAARRSGLFPEHGSAAAGGLGSIYVPGDDSHERYQLTQEFDDPRTGIERFEASAGANVWHGTTPYSTRYVSIDYFAGATSRFGYDGQSRRFDVYGSYMQTTFGHLVEISPTYSLPLARRGRTSGWVSFTLDAPIGTTSERYAGVSAGIEHQASRRVNLAFSATRYWARDQTGSFAQRLEMSAGARLSL